MEKDKKIDWAAVVSFAKELLPKMMKYDNLGEARCLHMMKVGENAYKVARQTAGKPNALDPDKAYALGLLHDVGRWRPSSLKNVPHEVIGYKTLQMLGLEEAAPIALTHSMPASKFTRGDFAKGAIFMGNADSQIYSERFIRGHEMNDYDRLIQFCDVISNHDCNRKIEDSLAGFQARFGFSQEREDKFKAIIDAMHQFEDKFGINIYETVTIGKTDEAENKKCLENVKKADKANIAEEEKAPMLNFEDIKKLYQKHANKSAYNRHLSQRMKAERDIY